MKEKEEKNKADRYRATARAASTGGIRSGKPNGGEKKAIKGKLWEFSLEKYAIQTDKYTELFHENFPLYSSSISSSSSSSFTRSYI